MEKTLWHTLAAAVLPVALRTLVVGVLTGLLVAGLLPRVVVAEVCAEILGPKPFELLSRL